jgi:hypothetical protein
MAIPRWRRSRATHLGQGLKAFSGHYVGAAKVHIVRKADIRAPWRSPAVPYSVAMVLPPLPYPFPVPTADCIKQQRSIHRVQLARANVSIHAVSKRPKAAISDFDGAAMRNPPRFELADAGKETADA